MKLNFSILILALLFFVFGMVKYEGFISKLGNIRTIYVPNYTPPLPEISAISTTTLPAPTNIIPAPYVQNTCYKLMNQTYCESN